MLVSPRRLRIFIIILALHRMPNVRSPRCLLLLWLLIKYFSGHSFELIKLPLTIVLDINLPSIVLQRLTIDTSCLGALRPSLSKFRATLLFAWRLILFVVFSLCLHLNSFFFLLVEIFCDEEALLLLHFGSLRFEFS